MPRFKIHHLTKYSYDTPVRDSANQVMLFPVKDEFQELVRFELNISGEPQVDIFKDYYGNEAGAFTHAEPHRELLIDLKTELITRKRPICADDIPAASQWEELEKIHYRVPYIDFLKQEQFKALKELKEAADPLLCHEHTTLQSALRFNQFVFDSFKYIKGITTVESTLDEVWTLKAGVCQDFAHILLTMLRLVKIPARYVSGYVCPNKNGMRGEGATHAWVEAYIPFYGWMGLDPTNNCIADDLHVRLAVGRNFSDCSPVKGTYKGDAAHKLEVGVAVSYEDGNLVDESAAILTPQPAKTNSNENSYRRHMEMMQQQQ